MGGGIKFKFQNVKKNATIEINNFVIVGLFPEKTDYTNLEVDRMFCKQSSITFRMRVL